MTIPPTPSFIVDFQFRANLQRLNRITQSIRNAQRMIGALMERIRRAMSRVNDEQNNFNNNARNMRRNSRSMSNGLMGLASSATRVAAAFGAVGYAAVKMGDTITDSILNVRDLAAMTGESAAGLFTTRNAMKRAGVPEATINNLMTKTTSILSALKSGQPLGKETDTLIAKLNISPEELAVIEAADLLKKVIEFIANEPDSSVRSQISILFAGDNSLASITKKQNAAIQSAVTTEEDIKMFESAEKGSMKFREMKGRLSASFDELGVSVMAKINNVIEAIEKWPAKPSWFIYSSPSGASNNDNAKTITQNQTNNVTVNVNDVREAKEFIDNMSDNNSDNSIIFGELQEGSG